MARVRVQIPVDQSTQQPITEPGNQPSSISRFMTKKNLIIVGIAGLILLIIILITSLLNDRKQLKEQVNKLSTNQSTGAQADNQKYQAEVAKIVNVPDGITPLIGTLTEDKIAQLSKDNSLYRDAEANDVFLLYNNTDKSRFLVIYRPSTKKIIQAVLDLTQQNTQPTSTKTK